MNPSLFLSIAQFRRMEKTNFILYFFALTLFSCRQAPNPPAVQAEQLIEKSMQLTVDPRLVALFDSLTLKGSVVIWDPSLKRYYSNDFTRTKVGFLPASTFKIPNTLIGLETGYLADENHIFKWNGEKQNLKVWEQDLNLRDAFQSSCVPCYRELARGVGFEAMQTWLEKLAFGKMELTAENLDLFWLRGTSKITQGEQIDFLQRFYEKKLPISDRNHGILKKVMLVNQTKTYQLSAKSGTSAIGEQLLGWYVGFVEKEEKVYYFAANLEQKGQLDFMAFAKQRTSVTLQALSLILGEDISLK